MKRFLALIMISMLLLCACASQPSQVSPGSASDSYIPEGLGVGKADDASGDEAAAGAEASPVPGGSGEEEDVAYTGVQRFSNDAGTSIDVLREELERAGALFGVADLGYYEYIEQTGIELAQWLYGNIVCSYYPFVYEIDEAHTIGEKGRLYCIVARDFDASLEVSTPEGELLYRAKNGDPIMVFANLDGDVLKGDIAVTVTLADGSACSWQPRLDESGYVDLPVGNERELLGMDFAPIEDTGIDLDAWMSEGWSGVTALGLAYDEAGTYWWISTWDNSVSYCLSFYLCSDDVYDGTAVLECYYDGDTDLQAQWEGWWSMETQPDQPSRLYMELSLVGGADAAAFKKLEHITESYLTMVPPSGNNLLLIAENDEPRLPIFPEGVQVVELTLEAG